MTRGQERAALAAILALAALLRLGACGADVPIHDGISYAPVQDAFWYLEAASSAAEGVAVDPEPGYDPPVWVPLARVWFALAGCSWGSACALAGLISVGLVLATWRLVRSALGPAAALASAAVLATLYPQLVQSRVPLVYGPLAVWLLAAAAVWLQGRTRPPAWRLGCEAAAWVMVLGAALAFRPPVLAFAGGLVCAHAVRARHGRALGLALLAAFGVVLLALAAFGRDALEPALGLLGWLAPERAATLRYRLGLQLSERLDLLALLGRAVRFLGPVGPGSGSGYLALAGGACATAAWGAMAVALRWRALRPAARELLALLLGTAATFLVGGLLMEQRPLRYFLLVGPSLAGVAGCAVAWLACPARAPVPPPRLGACLGLGGVATLAVAHGLEAAGLASSPLPWALGSGLTLAIAAAWRPWERPLGALGAPTRRLLAALLLLGACLGGALRGLELLIAPTWACAGANRAAARVLPTTAVPCGPWASSLTIGSGLRRLRGSWVITWPEDALTATLARLRAQGVTHLLVDVGQERNADLLVAFARRGAPLEPVAVLVSGGPSLPPPGQLPGAPVLVLRLAGLEGTCPRSRYETAQAADAKGEGPAEDDPELLAARLRVLARQGLPEQAAGLLARSLRANPSLAGARARLERALAGW